MRRIVHKHWFFGVQRLFWPTLTFIAVIGIAFWLPDKYVLWGALAGGIATVVWWLRNFMDYYLDVWLITNKGVIDLAWHGWFHRQASRTLYSDIQSVSYEIKGIPATVFQYGTIMVEKISTGAEVSLEKVHKPRLIETAILEALEAYMHKKNLKDATTVQNILAEFVAGSIQQKAFEAQIHPPAPVKKKK